MTDNGVPLSDKQQMIDWIAKGAGPADTWRIGTEHEKFLFYRNNLRPVTYEGENGVRVMVPPHIETGTRIVVRPEDASYVERAKN